MKESRFRHVSSAAFNSAVMNFMRFTSSFFSAAIHVLLIVIFIQFVHYAYDQELMLCIQLICVFSADAEEHLYCC